jgi:hypothetical protein
VLLDVRQRTSFSARAVPYRRTGEAKDQTMSTIRRAHLRRLTATILIGFAILLPALFGRAPAQTDAPAGKPAAAIVLSSAPAL